MLAKARGLLAATRKVPASVFEVGRYTVIVREDGPWCSCPATTTCSHIAAAGMLAMAEQKVTEPQVLCPRFPGLGTVEVHVRLTNSTLLPPIGVTIEIPGGHVSTYLDAREARALAALLAEAAEQDHIRLSDRPA